MVCTSPRDRSNSNGSASDCRYSNSNRELRVDSSCERGGTGWSVVTIVALVMSMSAPVGVSSYSA